MVEYKPRTIKDAIYNVWLPAAIRYGISYETFWSLNPRIMDIYQKAYIQKKKEEFEQIETMAWLNGRYVMSAVGACFSKNAKYPELPQRNNNSEKTEGISDDLRAEIAAKKFEAFAEVFNKKFENKQGGEKIGK